MIVIFNQRSDPLFLDRFQCCCDIHDFPICNFVKQRRIACRNVSRDNFHYRIHDCVVIVAHGGETWIGQSGGERMGGIQ